MEKERENKWEREIRFVARRYREGALDPGRAWERFAAARGIRRGVAFRRYWAGVAAAVLALVGLGVWLAVERTAPRWVAVSAEPGQAKEWYLPDNTHVTLAGGARARYDARLYGRAERVVEMSGKAFFRVARDEARPFSVRTDEATVTVLGTRFQVDETAEGTEVSVSTGKVRFAAGREAVEPVVLTAGMAARYSSADRAIRLLEEPDPNAEAWRTGVLRFRETPLEQVMADLGEHYGVRVENRTAGSAAAGKRLTATFDHLSLDEALQVINQTLDVRLVALPGSSSGKSLRR